MQAHRYRWSETENPAVRQRDAVKRTLQDSLEVWRAIDDSVRTCLQENPSIAFKDLLPRVLRLVAPSLGNDPEPQGVPSGALSTIAAHWREQRGHQ